MSALIKRFVRLFHIHKKPELRRFFSSISARLLKAAAPQQNTVLGSPLQRGQACVASTGFLQLARFIITQIKHETAFGRMPDKKQNPRSAAALRRQLQLNARLFRSRAPALLRTVLSSLKLLVCTFSSNTLFQPLRRSRVIWVPGSGKRSADPVQISLHRAEGQIIPSDRAARWDIPSKNAKHVHDAITRATTPAKFAHGPSASRPNTVLTPSRQ